MNEINVNKPLIIESLGELADIQYQQKLWFHGIENKVSSYQDCICRLFDDSVLELALDRNDVTFTKEIDAEFRKLSKLIDVAPEITTEEELMEDKALYKIRSLSSHLLEMLNQS